jgi:GntR family transcriptional regulator
VFDEHSPIYRQIAEQIRADVLSGTLGEDEQVMSTTQYASFYRINPATAAKAFQELVDEGILYKRRGVGMFVAPGAREHLRAQRRARFFDDVVDPVVAEAHAIGVSVDEVVRRIREVAAGPEAPSAARAASEEVS